MHQSCSRPCGPNGPQASSGQVVLEGEGRGGGSRRHADLAEDVAEVAPDSVLADDQYRGDVAVGQAPGDQLQHLDLPIAQRLGVLGRTAGKGTGTVGIRLRPQPRERGSRGLELEHGGLLVTRLPSGHAESQPHLSDLVGTLQMLEGRRRFAQQGDGAVDIALSQEQCTV